MTRNGLRNKGYRRFFRLSCHPRCTVTWGNMRHFAFWYCWTLARATPHLNDTEVRAVGTRLSKSSRRIYRIIEYCFRKQIFWKNPNSQALRSKKCSWINWGQYRSFEGSALVIGLVGAQLFFPTNGNHSTQSDLFWRLHFSVVICYMPQRCFFVFGEY
jgi:hypothetical protein